MKQGLSDSGILYDEKGNISCISLGWDFTAEHEWGIDSLKRKFGIDFQHFSSKDLSKINFFNRIFAKRKINFAAKKSNSVPEIQKGSFLEDRKTWYYITTLYSYKEKTNFKEKYGHYLHQCKRTDKKIIGYWNESDFLMLTTEKAAYDYVADAIKNKQLVLTLSGSENPFSNAGLCLIDYRNIPAEKIKKFDAESEEIFDKNAKAADTGIYQLLEESGKKFTSLSYKASIDKFWLNPFPQDKYSAGWYSLEELKLWAKNEGPVLYKNKFKPGDKVTFYYNSKNMKGEIISINSDSHASIKISKRKTPVIKEMRYIYKDRK